MMSKRRAWWRALPVVALGLIACGGTSIRSGTDPEGSDPGGNNVGTGARDPGGISGNSVSATGGFGGTVTGSFGGSFGGNIAGGFGTCFEAGSLVATPSGSVPIERLRIGDQVLAFDEQAGSVAARRVTATFVHEVEESGRLALADGRVLRVTAEHPIYDARLGDYVRADAFDGDETLVTLVQTQTPGELSSTGAATALPSLGLATSDERGFVSHETGERVAVFNISVEGLENYFVEGVLVHNKSGSSTGPTCVPTPSTQAPGACGTTQVCSRPASPELGHVALNQPAQPEPNGEGGAFSGSAGAPAEAGSPGDADAPLPSYTLPYSAPLCPDTPVGVPLFVAVDYKMPETPGTPGFTLFDGDICEGRELGQVWLDDEAAPPPGSITTQCVKVVLPQAPNHLTATSLDLTGGVANVRFATSCDCYRGLRQHTSCGVVGDSGCQ